MEFAPMLQTGLDLAVEHFPDFFDHPSGEWVLFLADPDAPIARALGLPPTKRLPPRAGMSPFWIFVERTRDFCAELRAAPDPIGAKPGQLVHLAEDLEAPIPPMHIHLIVAVGEDLRRSVSLVAPQDRRRVREPARSGEHEREAAPSSDEKEGA